MRGFAHTLSVTCESCRTVLDTSSGEASILAKAQAKYTIQPLIPLGSRGKFDGVDYEAIGFEQRYTIADGETHKYRLWVILGKEKLEHSIMFTDVDKGRERLARPP